MGISTTPPVDYNSPGMLTINGKTYLRISDMADICGTSEQQIYNYLSKGLGSSEYGANKFKVPGDGQTRYVWGVPPWGFRKWLEEADLRIKPSERRRRLKRLEKWEADKEA